MAVDITNFRDFYKVSKTITFELISHDPHETDVQFSKTAEFTEKEYFRDSGKAGDGVDDLKKIQEAVAKLVTFADDFSQGLKDSSFSFGAFAVKKEFIEKCDRDLYHKLKKKRVITAKKINPVTRKSYDYEIRFTSPMSLENVLLLDQEMVFVINTKIQKLIARISLFGQKIADNLASIYSKQSASEKVLYFASSKAVFYGYIKIYLSLYAELAGLIGLTDIAKKSVIEGDKAQATRAMQQRLQALHTTYHDLAENIKKLDEVVNEAAKKPVILTSLNPRAVNKDPKKIDSEYQKVKQLEQKIQKHEWRLDGISRVKFDVTQQLENKLKQHVKELKILQTNIQPIINKKKLQYSSLTEQEKNILQQFKFAKTVLKYIKQEGVVIEDITTDLFNYQKPVERLKKHRLDYVQIEKHPQYKQVEKEYREYKNLVSEKRTLSLELGDAKSLYNAISREVLRQKEMQYLSCILKDSQGYYYLMLIDKEKNKQDCTIKNLRSQHDKGGWEMLDYNKLTFKAIEKLALLDQSTFDISDLEFTVEAKLIMRSYKEKQYKDYRLSRQERQSGLDQTILQKKELIRLIDYIKKVIDHLPDVHQYHFQFKPSDQYKTLEDFADDIDRQGYYTTWKKIDHSTLLRLENDKTYPLYLFKLHNQDFRRHKLQDPTRKHNLFTRYWLDAMALKKEIRLTPEIDVLKRAKDEPRYKSKESEGKQVEVLDKPRNSKNKLYASLHLEFYPTKKADFEMVNKKVIFGEQVCFLGIDRGENSLASWCLIDSNKKVIANGDWTEFEIANEQGLTRKVNFAEQLKKFYMQLKDKHGNVIKPTSDQLRLAFMEAKEEKHEAAKRELLKKAKDLEMQLELQNQLASEYIKQAYCSYLIKELHRIIKDYPQTYIVLEDLDIAGKSREDENLTNKLKNLEKTMGATVYQAIENALINKFQYYTHKEKSEYDGLQLVPNIVRVEDLRIVEKADTVAGRRIKCIKSKEKIGNLLFVDEFMTSDQCPRCGFSHRDVDFNKLSNIEENEGDYLFSFDDKFLKIPKHILDKKKVDKLIENYKTPNQILDKKVDKLIENYKTPNQIGEDIINIFHVRLKKAPNYFKQAKKEDNFHCPSCQFSSTNLPQDDEFNLSAIKTGDDLAAYNIAVRGWKEMQKHMIQPLSDQ